MIKSHHELKLGDLKITNEDEQAKQIVSGRTDCVQEA